MSTFSARSSIALQDANLQAAMDRAGEGFIGKRLKSLGEIENYTKLRDQGARIKQHSLANLHHYLQKFEVNAKANGAGVHWASDGEELNEIVLNIARQHKTKLITKGKSMVSEETELTRYLEEGGLDVVETDLGEYIIQLGADKPSHIVAPAVHKTRSEISDLFRKHHKLGDRSLNEPAEMVEEARQVLREKFVEADLGITGANFLIADIGAMMLITNEGNGDLCASLPPVHIATVGIEKVVPTLRDAWLLMRLLTNNASGQRVTCYISLLFGPGMKNNERHFILLDNGRSDIYRSKYAAILQCIRCGACMNHCPVYGAVGGKAYDAVYPGPLGAVLTPLMTKTSHDLPHASSLCGRCSEVCPVKIPLADLIRDLRADNPRRFGLWRIITKCFSFLARHPIIYALVFTPLNYILRLALLVHVKRS